MVVHTCKKCNKEFNHKAPYDYHINKMKRSCIKKQASPIIFNDLAQTSPSPIKKFKCPKCNKTYANKSNLNRHTSRSCKAKLKFKTDYGGFEDLKIDKTIKFDNTNVDKTLSFENNNILVAPNVTKFNENLVETSHLRKNTPKFDSQLKTPQDDKFRCNYCVKTFTRRSSLSRHISDRCKVKIQDEKDKEKIYYQLIDQMKEQQQKIKNLEDKMINNTGANINNSSNSTINTGTINNNTQNTTYNFNIVAFGKEDLYSIDDDTCKKYLHRGYQCVPKMVENTHFNVNKPEYHNVYIPNMKDLYAMIYDGKRWGLKEKSDVINQLFDDKQCYLIDKYNELKDDLDPVTIKKFGRFLNHSDDEIYDGIKKDIKLLLYNKRDIPLKTRKSLERKKLT